MPSLLNRFKRSVEHAIRQRSARQLLVALKRATHRLPSKLVVPTRSRVLVIAPHADDEVIPCGGTLLRHRELGSLTRVVLVTDGTSGLSDAALAGQMRRVRLAEFERVTKLLQCESVVQLDFPDSKLVQHEERLTLQLTDQIRTFHPDVIYCPFPADGQADHQACALALANAAVHADWKGKIHAWETWTTLWPNIMIDISDQAEEKEYLIRMYASQMADRDYAAASLGLNRYRGLRHRIAAAEAFYACGAREFQTLTGLLNQLAPSAPNEEEQDLHVAAPSLDMGGQPGWDSSSLHSQADRSNLDHRDPP